MSLRRPGVCDNQPFEPRASESKASTCSYTKFIDTHSLRAVTFGAPSRGQSCSLNVRTCARRCWRCAPCLTRARTVTQGLRTPHTSLAPMPPLRVRAPRTRRRRPPPPFFCYRPGAPALRPGLGLVAQHRGQQPRGCQKCRTKITTVNTPYADLGGLKVAQR